MKQRAAVEHDQPQVSRWHFREKLMQLKQLLNNDRSNKLIEVVEDQDVNWSARALAWLKLLALPPYKPKLTLTGLYWATSGFGERAVRAWVWLLALLLLPFLANSTLGAWFSSLWAALPCSTHLNAVSGWVQNSTNATAAAGFIPLMKEVNGDGWRKIGQAIWQGVIILQFAPFALAARNRFRR